MCQRCGMGPCAWLRPGMRRGWRLTSCQLGPPGGWALQGSVCVCVCVRSSTRRVLLLVLLPAPLRLLNNLQGVPDAGRGDEEECALRPYCIARPLAAYLICREFQTPDEEMKKIVLKVVKQCVGTEGVEPDYIRTEVGYFAQSWFGP